VDRDVALYFRDQFRSARAAAHSDAEGYQEVLFALERLGTYCYGRVAALGSYAKIIGELACLSPLAVEIPRAWREAHVPFATLYELVREARNDALHQGAFARHLTAHAVQLALVLEDALMTEALCASEFMVRDVAHAYAWQPVSFVRQQMLANSFSHLPIQLGDALAARWHLIPDIVLARFLRVSPEVRKLRLAMTIADALATGELSFPVASCCSPDTSVDQLLPQFDGHPILVLDEQRLLGILTAFDLL
jgi:hypothetical protein